MAMDDKDRDFDHDYDRNICSLSGSGDPGDLAVLEDLANGSDYFCLTCKGSSRDPKKLCSPAFK
jgi:hypothetical protein